MDDGGRIAAEWAGPHYYSGNVGLDDAEPEYVYCTGSAGARTMPMRFRVDYERKTWRVDSYFWGLTWSGFPYDRHSVLLGSYRPLVRRRDGRMFLVLSDGNHPVLRLEGELFVPAAAVGKLLPAGSLDEG